jgi:hypothetical protein
MNQNQNPQLQSLIRSILKVVGSILVTHGATATASLVNNEDACGLITLIVGLLLSAQWHAPKPIVRPAEVPAADPRPAPQDALARSNASSDAGGHQSAAPPLGALTKSGFGAPVSDPASSKPATLISQL